MEEEKKGVAVSQEMFQVILEQGFPEPLFPQKMKKKKNGRAPMTYEEFVAK